MAASKRYGSVQKLYTLRAHDSNVSKEEVIFNPSFFPELGVKPGDLIQVVAIKETAALTSDKNLNASKDGHRPTSADSRHTANARRGPVAGVLIFDENGRRVAAAKEPDKSRTYVFLVQDPSTYPKKNQDVGLSISSTIANTFGFKNRMQVLVSLADEAVHAASHVEITFRDQYLSRADMWRLAVAELSQKTIYKDQKLEFLETIKATVKTIYQNGEKRKAGYFGSSTRAIFRSESARYIIFIQMSLEMWQFDVEGGGEIMFNKVINGFLPELFKNWASIRARHRISFVLFSRVDYDDEDPRNLPDLDDEHGYRSGTRDFYRVVVSDVSSGDWISILHQLKREFRTFLRDITIQKSNSTDSGLRRLSMSSDIDPDYVIVGKPSTAAKGNILEAINLALTQFSGDYIDRDLLRTGISVMVITAGSGVYEVDYTLLRHTTETLIGSGIGIDLVCLAPMPLHSVPLFKYRNPRIAGAASSVHHTNASSMENTPRQHDLSSVMTSRTRHSLERTISGISGTDSELFAGDWSYAIPHWVDVSFWKGTTDELALDFQLKNLRTRKSRDSRTSERSFALRCVLYELEMMGFMENEMTNIAIPLIHEHPLHPWQKLRHRITGRPANQIDRPGVKQIDEEWMDDYDDGAFRAANKRFTSDEAAKRLFRAGLADRSNAARISGSTNNESQPEINNGKLRTYSGLVESRLPERHPSRIGTARRAPSIMSLTSNADRESIASKSSLLTRQISYGTPTLAAPQETRIEGKAEAALARLVSGSKEPKARQVAPNYFDTFRAMFAKSVVQKEQTNDHLDGMIPEETDDNIEDEVTGRPSKPIDIGPSAAPRMKHHSRTSSTEEKIGSMETVKANAISPKKFSLPKSMRVEDGGAILYVASNTRRSGNKPGLSSSGEGPRITQTLSPLRGIAPWLVLVNPSNPLKNPSNLDNRFRRWHHIFPKPLKVSAMKWKSLSSPASVPLTNDFFPTAQQLADEYSESTYSIVQNVDDEIVEEKSIKEFSKEALIRELIGFRLAKGFQLIVGASVSEFLGTLGAEYADIFDKAYMVRDGATVFMSMGNIIHQLLCISSGEVEVRRFQRKPIADVEAVEGSNPLEYRPYIRAALSSTYEASDIKFAKETTEYNWNYIDSFLAGYQDDLSENLRFWRARFVFIPVEIPNNPRRPLPMLTEDSEEEIRLEGIRKLTTIWQRDRIQHPEERGFQSSRRRQDRNPLMIDYQTRDPSAVIAAGSEGLLLADGETSGLIFSDTDRYSTESIDLQKLANDLQGEKGIPMVDRRWHWKVYQSCFIGFDLVSWLLDRFRDIETREDAVELGKELMGKGLFQHVSKKHEFRDGNFFFHLSSLYSIPRGEKSWFGSKRGQASVPSTPTPDTSRPNYLAESLRARPSTSSSSETSCDEKSSSISEGPRRKVILSHVMRYNVDPKKRSYRPEIINLHYDRLHSPDNCYHFRIDWMNVTAKFIEDAVNAWAIHGRKFGLKLVEIPIQEAATISSRHPFRGPYTVKLAVPPPAVSPREPHEITTGASKEISPDRFAVHKAILKKLNFVLDVESASSFPSDVDIVYSWGKNDYKLTQYLHRSGTTVAQITEDGEFLLLANRLFNDRSFVVREGAKFDRKDDLYDFRGSTRPSASSPMSSPVVRPVPENSIETERKTAKAEEIKEEVEAFCSNQNILKAFYDELKKPIPSPSPAMSSTYVDTPVPSLRLPPRVTNSRDEKEKGSPVTSASGRL
jgi:hypothetical protein